MRSLARSALFALSFVLTAPVALAQSDADRATARELGKDGQAALDKKDWKTAEDLFRRAESLFHAPTLVLGYARAEVGLGKVVSAAESYNRIIREGVAPGAPAAFVEALAAARAEVGPVQARIATVTISIVGPTDPKVTLDDVPVPGAALGVKRPIDPGSHVVKASADGWESGQTAFSVGDAGAATAAVTLIKAAPVMAAVPPPFQETPMPAPAPGPSATAADTGGSSSGSTQRVLGITGMAVGGAGIVLGAITGGLAVGKHSTLSSACSGSTCPASEADTISSYHTLGTLSTVGFIAGAVLAGGGAVLFFTAPHGNRSASATTVQPYLGLGSLGAVGHF